MTYSDDSFPKLVLAPKYGVSVERIAPALVVAFGDGYEQRSQHRRKVYEVWNVEIDGISDAEYEALEAQLKQFKGVQEFLWHPRNEETEKLFKCRLWSRIHLAKDVNSFQARFEQVMDLGIPLYFVEAGKPLYIICPVPYQITQVESNGVRFVWTQLEGGRLAVIDPPNVLTPMLYILDDVRDHRPIRLRISIANKPEINDELIIYTTPTSDLDGVSYEQAIAAPDAATCRQVPNATRPAAPLPQFLQRAYASLPGTYTFTWDLPTCDAQFLAKTIVQQNTTGHYVDLQDFPINSNRLFAAQLNTHYRINSIFNVYGHISTSSSQILYFTSGNRIVIGDDNFNGLSFNQTKVTKNILPLGRISLTTVDNSNGLSFTKIRTIKNTLPLGVSRYSTIDNHNGLSFTQLKSTVQKINLGGVIIQ